VNSSDVIIRRSQFIKGNLRQNLPALPFVSVIVPTLGRKWLEGCLRALAQYEYPRYEVILVCDVHRKGPGYARNRGLEVAKGDLIHFIDDDAVPSPSNLQELVQAFVEIKKRDSSVGGVSGAIVDRLGNKSVVCTLSFPALGLRVSSKIDAGITDYAFTGNALFPREILDEVKGFDDEISHQFEDVDLSMKIRNRGYRLYAVPEATVYHVGREEAKGSMRQDKQLREFYASKNYVLLLSKWISFSDAFLRGSLLALANVALIFASIFVAIVAKITKSKSAFLREIDLPHIRFQKALGSLYGLAVLSRRMKALGSEKSHALQLLDDAEQNKSLRQVETQNHAISGRGHQAVPSSARQIGSGRESSPLVSVVVVNYNGLHLLMRSLPSIARQDYPRLDVIVVDNASTDKSLQYVTELFPVFKCIRAKRNLYYVKAANIGIRESHGQLLLLMNNDVVLDRSFVSNMVAAARDHADAGIFGPKTVFYGTSFVQYAAGRIHLRTQRVPSWLYSRVESVDWITGAVWMIRRSVIERVGLLDEENYTFYYDETDFQIRARKSGVKMIYVPSALASHIDSATIKAGSESQAYHFTRGYIIFGLIHLPFKDAMIRLVKVLGASAIDIKAGRASSARARLFALLKTLEKLPRTFQARRTTRRLGSKERVPIHLA